MADFYPVLARAVSQLPVDAPQARRDLYDYARGILIAQLRERDPGVSLPELMREKAALKSAIRKVEAAALPAPRRPSIRLSSDRAAPGPGGGPGGGPQGRNVPIDVDAVFRVSNLADGERSVPFSDRSEHLSAAVFSHDDGSRSNPIRPGQSATNQNSFSVKLDPGLSQQQPVDEHFSTEIDNLDFGEFIAQSDMTTKTSVDPFVDRTAPRPVIMVSKDTEALDNPNALARSAPDDIIRSWDHDREDALSRLAVEDPSTRVGSRGADWTSPQPEPHPALGSSVNRSADRKRPAIGISQQANDWRKLNEASYQAGDENVRKWKSDRRAVLQAARDDLVGRNEDPEHSQNPYAGRAPSDLSDPIADRLKTRLALNRLTGPTDASRKSSGANPEANDDLRRSEPDPVQRKSRISSQANARSVRTQPMVGGADEPASFGLALLGLGLFVAVLAFVAITCVPLVVIHFPRLLWFAQHLFDSPKALATITITSSLLLLLFVPIFRKRRKKSALGLLWRSMRPTMHST